MTPSYPASPGFAMRGSITRRARRRAAWTAFAFRPLSFMPTMTLGFRLPGSKRDLRFMSQSRGVVAMSASMEAGAETPWHLRIVKRIPASGSRLVRPHRATVPWGLSQRLDATVPRRLHLRRYANTVTPTDSNETQPQTVSDVEAASQRLRSRRGTLLPLHGFLVAYADSGVRSFRLLASLRR